MITSLPARLLYTAALIWGAPVLASAASFDCVKANSAVESMICTDPRLSLMDDELARLYRSAKAVAPDQTGFKKETNDEWRRRARCTDRECIIAWYQHRTSQLTPIVNQARTPTAPAPPTPAPKPQLPVTLPAPEDNSTFSSPLFWLIAGVCFIVWVIKRLAAAGRRDATKAAARTEGRSSNVKSPENSLGEDKSVEVRVRWQGPTRKSAPPKRSGQAVQTVWVSPGRTVVIKGVSIPRGMIYVGSTLNSADGSTEPAQIDPTLEVDSQPASPQERLFGYWPRYDDISAIARRAYLTWLAAGRSDPNADVGYVFLFFYGLERRVLVDAKKDAVAQAEVPAILAEVERLRGIYSNRSFQSYTRGFLDYVIASASFAKALYKNAPPAPTSNRGMPLQLRAGLGQSAVDRTPVPGAWALCWIRSEPNVSLPRAAARCAEQFDQQFLSLYSKRFSEGIKLSVNRTKLKVSYRPASAGLLTEDCTSSFGELPDVTTVVAPLKQLQKVIDEAGESLEGYSRFIGRHQEKAQSLEATVLLPKSLWSESVKSAVSALDTRVGTGMVVIKLGELLAAFGGAATLSREMLKNLFTLLGDERIGVEPDVLAGARAPKAEESVVLFRLGEPAVDMSPPAEAAYSAVAVMLDLAITLANADGKISGREVQFLNRQVDNWVHVGESAQRRLRARLRLGIVYPPNLASLKNRIEPLPAAARTALGKLLVALAMVDGKLDPEEVKHLEKVYAALNIDRTILYSDLHGITAAAERGPQNSRESRSPAVPTPAKPEPGVEREPANATGSPLGTMQLDQSRIAALQAESERVTALLSKVFEEQAPTSPAEVTTPVDQESEPTDSAPQLMGLDGEHSAFLRVLLTRRSWSRAELNDIAADMELMLDGALERVNEAALDKFDARIAEGDDPIEIVQDLLETVNA